MLADPMCGSGTFLIEAALIAQGHPPGLDRPSWPFHAWPDFDKQAWQRSSEKAAAAKQAAQSKEIKLLGNDIYDLSLAKRHVAPTQRKLQSSLLSLQ